MTKEDILKNVKAFAEDAVAKPIPTNIKASFEQLQYISNLRCSKCSLTNRKGYYVSHTMAQ